MNEKKPIGRIRRTLDLFSYKKKDIVLDAGCKNSWLKNYVRNCFLVSFDIDEKEILKNNNKNSLVSNVRFMPFKNNSINHVFLLEVLEHLPKGKEIQALKEINRILKKRGTLLLSTPNDSFLFKNLDPAYWLIAHRHYKLSEVKKLLLKSGFKIEHEYVGGGVFEIIWIWLFYFARLFNKNAQITFLDKLIDGEYSKKGKNTIIIKAVKK